MSELGELLKNTRLERQLTLKEVSKATKISTSTLELLENGEFSKLPSTTYTIGFLKIYADFLKLDFNKIKELFEIEAITELKKQLYTVEDKPDLSKKTSSKKIIYYLSTLIIIAILIAVSIIIKNKLYLNKDAMETVSNIIENNATTYNEELEIDNSDYTHIDNESISESNVIETSEVSPIEVVRQFNEQQPTPEIKTPQNVILEFNDTCWVHINIDGEKQVDFIAESGYVKNIEFNNYFILDIGNATAVKIKYKNQTFSGLGGWRQPIKGLHFKLDDAGHLVFTKQH